MKRRIPAGVVFRADLQYGWRVKRDHGVRGNTVGIHDFRLIGHPGLIMNVDHFQNVFIDVVISRHHGPVSADHVLATGKLTRRR